MKYFITGASGYIGRHLVAALKGQGHDLICPTSKELDLSNSEINLKGAWNYDGFIHCAGINQVGTNLIAYESLLNVNTNSFVRICDQLQFNDGANIIALGSVYTHIARRGRIQYAMSKAALLAAAKTLALQMSDKHCKVNLISPAYVENLSAPYNERIEHIKGHAPLGLVKLEGLVELIIFMLTKNVSITGQEIIVDGGYSIVYL